MQCKGDRPFYFCGEGVTPKDLGRNEVVLGKLGHESEEPRPKVGASSKEKAISA